MNRKENLDISEKRGERRGGDKKSFEQK